jgi:polyphosphate kinase
VIRPAEARVTGLSPDAGYASRSTTPTPWGPLATSTKPFRPPGIPAASNEQPPRYLDRELSWLQFNERVLALAEDDDLPLLDRVKFLAIFSQNMDEFFQVRVAGLKDQLATADRIGRSADRQSPADQLRAIRAEVQTLVRRQQRAFLGGVEPALADAGIAVIDWSALGDDDRRELIVEFEERIFPVLTPLAVDPGHPFPYVSSLSLNLAVSVRDRQTDERRFARVKIPPLLPRFVALRDGTRFVPSEQVIAAHLGALFPGMEIESHAAFRVTRKADLALEEDAQDLLEAVELELRRRRFGRAVRLEIDRAMPEASRELLVRELEISPDDVYLVDGPLDLSGLWAVNALDRPELKSAPFAPVTASPLADVAGNAPDLFAVLREGDVLVHHPYDSFATSVVAFVQQAAADPKVLAIKQTLYRTSGDSPIVRALIDAVERGKQVVVLVELQARFDEQANIVWARALERAGVHVVYGLVGFKTHTKTALVVRDEGDRMRRYCHVGTGNYNPQTARVYEDVGLLSADEELGADLSDLFNSLTGFSRQSQYRRLLVSTTSLRRGLAEMIRAEIGAAPEERRIVMKMNNLVDPEIIDVLYEASGGGVPIDLIVRSVCCLRPGVPGLSETIRVRSIVGRYLEHSRIFAFGGGERQRFFMGSADLMPRNLDRRVEAVTPITQPDLKARLANILEVNLADDTLAWSLGPDGAWTKVPTVAGVNAHDRLQEIALLSAVGAEREPAAPNGGRR